MQEAYQLQRNLSMAWPVLGWGVGVPQFQVGVVRQYWMGGTPVLAGAP